MSTQQILLGLLEQAPCHGYDLKREYEARFPDLRPLRFSQIYSTLGRLDRDGLVTLVSEGGGQGPDKKQYALTDSGVSELEEWLATPIPVGDPPQGELFLKVALALLSGRSARPLLKAQRSAHQARMRELTKEKTGATSEASIVLCDYSLFHLDADLRWIDHTVRRLDKLAAEFSGPVR